MIDLVEQPVFEEFLTLPAYDRILADEKAAA
jgi:malate synthase